MSKPTPNRATCHPGGRIPAWFRVGLAMFFISAGANMFTALLPVYRTVDGLTQSQVTFLFGIYIFGLIPALLFGGPASDRLGRRTFIRAALLLSIAGSSITAVAHITNPVLIGVGRLLTGTAIGCVMAAGASWIKELSGSDAVGARRATAASSAGFAMGPLFSGIIAQWLPFPDVWPFLVHLLCIIITVPLVWTTPEGSPTRAPGHPKAALIPHTARHPHFLLGIAAWAPWVFGTACTSFAVVPLFLDSPYPVAFNGLIAGLTMIMGVIVQPFVPRFRIHPSTVGLLFATVGMIGMLGVVTTRSLWISIPTVIVLGCSYGIMMVSGLREVQTIAHPDELGALTGVYYSLTYVGMFAPFAIANVAALIGYVPIFLFGILVTLGSIPPVRWATKRARQG